MMWARCLVVLLVTLVVSASSSPAQPLADRIPDDAMVYVGWKGTGQLGAAYEKSHLKAVVDASDWRQFVEEFIPAILAKAGEQDEEAAEMLRVGAAVGRTLWRHETAFYFGGMIAGQAGGQPSPKLALVVRAGADAPELARQIAAHIERAGARPPIEIKAAAYQDLVAVTTGAWPGFETLLGADGNGAPAAPALGASPRFKAAMANAQSDAAVAVYVDVEAIVKMVDGFVALGAGPREQQIWRKARKIAGIGGVKQLVCTGGFEGRDWVSRAFLAAPAPRTGLVALLDGDPLSDEILKQVPQDAVVASAARVDLARVVAQARAATAAADPEWGRVVDDALAKASAFVGMDVEKDVLGALGPEWAVHISPGLGGNGMLGLCAVNRPRDTKKADEALAALAARATEAFADMTDGEPTIAFKTRKVGGLTLHYLAFPLVTPTWAVADGNLYVALYPQTVVSAAAYARGGGASILKNERFAAVRERLGNPRGASIAFADLPRTAPNSYGSWVAITRYAGIADLFGIDSPLMLIPPIDRLLPELAPSGQASWVDDAGWHMTSVSPFPGAEALAQDPLGSIMTAQPAIAASIILPAFNRARETANRVKAASNLRMIGQGMMLYANENKGRYPATLGDVAKTQDLSVEVFTSPSSNTRIPQGLAGDQLARWVDENADFVYLGAGKTTTATPEEVLAYERPEIHGRDGFNVLFGDGHVEFVNYDYGMKLVRDQEAKDKQAPGKL